MREAEARAAANARNLAGSAAEIPLDIAAASAAATLAARAAADDATANTAVARASTTVLEDIDGAAEAADALLRGASSHTSPGAPPPRRLEAGALERARQDARAAMKAAKPTGLA